MAKKRKPKKKPKRAKAAKQKKAGTAKKRKPKRTKAAGKKKSRTPKQGTGASGKREKKKRANGAAASKGRGRQKSGARMPKRAPRGRAHSGARRPKVAEKSGLEAIKELKFASELPPPARRPTAAGDGRTVNLRSAQVLVTAIEETSQHGRFRWHWPVPDGHEGNVAARAIAEWTAAMERFRFEVVSISHAAAKYARVTAMYRELIGLAREDRQQAGMAQRHLDRLAGRASGAIRAWAEHSADHAAALLQDIHLAVETAMEDRLAALAVGRRGVFEAEPDDGGAVRPLAGEDICEDFLDHAGERYESWPPLRQRLYRIRVKMKEVGDTSAAGPASLRVLAEGVKPGGGVDRAAYLRAAVLHLAEIERERQDERRRIELARALKAARDDGRPPSPR